MFLFFIALAFSQSQTLDSHSQNALRQTQELLNNRVKREQAIQENPTSQAVGEKVEHLTLGNEEHKDQVFHLSAGALENIAKEAGGDAGKMQKIMQELQRNPAALKNYLSKEQLQQLKSLGHELQPKQKNP
tara:strand:+ start:1189 stop:1581 length:393 start_codon:yes stop_codon:yes gene_type:complete